MQSIGSAATHARTPTHVELRDVHLLQRVLRAELVDLVVDLVVDPRLIVVGGVVLDRRVHVLGLQLVDHLDPLEGDHRAARRAARDVHHLVGLHRRLHRRVRRHDRQHRVVARPRHAVEQRAAAPVDADVALRDAVDAAGQRERHHGEAAAERQAGAFNHCGLSAVRS